MHDDRQPVIADAQLKALRRTESPLAWLQAVQRVGRAVPVGSQPETRPAGEGFAVSPERCRL